MAGIYSDCSTREINHRRCADVATYETVQHSHNSSSNSDQVAAVLAAKGRIAAATSRAA